MSACSVCWDEFRYDDTGGYNPSCRCGLMCRDCCRERCDQPAPMPDAPEDEMPREYTTGENLVAAWSAIRRVLGDPAARLIRDSIMAERVTPATDTLAETRELSLQDWHALEDGQVVRVGGTAIRLSEIARQCADDRFTAIERADDALVAAREDTKMLNHLDTLASGITINGDRDFPSMGMTPKEYGFSHTRRLIEMDMLRRRAAVPRGETSGE